MAPVLKRRHQRLDQFDFVQRHGLRRELEIQQPTQCAQLLALIIDTLRVLPISVVTVGATGELQIVHRLRIPQVVLAIVAPLILAADVECDVVGQPLGKGFGVTHLRLARNRVDADATDAR